jgi:hypothetical protein
MAAFATQIPGYGGVVQGGGVYPVTLPNGQYLGDVRVYDDGTQIANITMPGHTLFYGFIVRELQVTSEGIYLQTFGEGVNYNGAIALANQWFGPTFWTQQDLLAKSYFDAKFTNHGN